ncbi:MAG: redoxin domain-containing protein, partial [Actinobacteria bacterium]|nr:redoxin domain-containing protein [Actinomycetota bacterium]
MVGGRYGRGLMAKPTTATTRGSGLSRLQPMGARTFIVFMAVLAVLGLLAYGLLSKGEQALAVGDHAPDKELSVLDVAPGDGGPTSPEGGTGRIADYRGQWVLVNFWASWCEPCREEAAALEAFHREHMDARFTVLGINLDDASDDAADFVREYALTYPQLRDGDGRERRDAYGMTGFPESFLIDPEGRVALIRRGSVDEAYLERHLLPLIVGAEAESKADEAGDIGAGP